MDAVELVSVNVGDNAGRALPNYKSLYKEENQDNLANNRMSTGELVDAVLVWQYPEEKEEREKLVQEVKQARGPPSDAESAVAKFYFREFYEAALTNDALKKSIAATQERLNVGNISTEERDKLLDDLGVQERTLAARTLKIEREMGQDGRSVFVKLHAPFETLCHVAEEIQLVMPLKKTGKVQNTLINSKLSSWMKNSIFGTEDLAEDSSYCGEFRVKHLDKFQNSDQPEKMFSPAQRNMLVYRILSQTRYDRLAKDSSNVQRFGIERMLRKEIYQAAYPLHDSSATKAPKNTAQPCERYTLARTWANWRLFYKMQPLQRVRGYFGEEVAFYFLWLGFYTQMLVPAAIVGLVIFIYGLGTYQDQTDAKDLCNSNLVICSQCSTCPQWVLSTACGAYKFSWVFDNGGTVFFAFFMALWATFFLEFWKRETAAKAYEWDVREFNETEPPRPDFRAVDKRPDPITQKLMPYFPSSIRLRRYLVSTIVILLMLSLVILSVIAVIVFRLAVRQALYDRYTSLQNSAAAITSALAAVLNLITIIVLNKVYDHLAIGLTNWENHEKQTEHEQALTLKVALFQFVNSYSSIFYIAFFKGQIVGRPGDRSTLFGYRMEECPQYGCLLELTIQLAVIMVGKQAAGMFAEVVLPWMMERIRLYFTMKRLKKLSRTARVSDSGTDAPTDNVTSTSALTPAGGAAPAGQAVDTDKIVTRWERQLLLDAYPSMGMFDEYLEMVIQFGYTTLFVPAFPLAPLCALVNNIFEMRLDARKLILQFRRPFAERCEDIGVWFDILSVMSIIAVISNAFVIAIPSSFIPKLVYYYSNGQSMSGYINVLYSPSPLSGNTTDSNCYYQGFRDASGSYSTLHYHIMMARLAFVICFEHAIFCLKLAFAYLIPDVPRRISLAIKREEYAAKLALEEALYGPADEHPAVVAGSS